MKKIYFIAVIPVLIIIAASCNPFEGSRNTMMHLFNPNNEQKIVVNDNNNSLEIRYSGEMEFNDDETAIKSMSPGGYMEYRKNGRRLLAEPDSRGEINYAFYGGGRQLNSDNNGKIFLAQAIQDMIAYGVNVKGRVERLYRDGGNPLVLQEIKKLKSDYVKKMYFEYLLNSDSISQEEMTDITREIGTKLNSDYEKRQLLEKVPAEYLKDSLTAHAYFTAVTSINSDYEKANAVKKILKQNLANESYDLVLQVAGTINSDNDKANLLKDLIRDGSNLEENFDALLEVVGNMNSEYDKVNVLKILIRKEALKGEHFTSLMTVVGKITSDNDKANLLKELIQSDTIQEENYDSLLEAIGTINSDNDKVNVLQILIGKEIFEGEHFRKLLGVIVKINSDNDKANVFKKLIEQPIGKEEQWVDLIGKTASITSDNDKANLLLQISKKMPRSETTKSAYLTACKTINSDHDYTRSVKGVQ